MSKTNQDAIKRLQTYVERCIQSEKDSKNKHIQAFWEREIKKTKSQIEKLQG